MTWRATHARGCTCLVPESDVLARTGLSAEELAGCTVFRIGDWTLERVGGSK